MLPYDDADTGMVGRRGTPLNPKVIERNKGPGEHEWIVCTNECDIESDADPTVAHMVQAIRDAYGESEIISELSVDPDVVAAFDLQDVLAGLRRSLPNPDAESGKPANLRTYRSETAEFFARETLRMVSDVETPPSLHACKGNAMQPLLGFDGWGLTATSLGPQALVLIQVKGSDDPACPPAVATQLVSECSDVPMDLDKLARALTACAVRVKGTAIFAKLIGMLETLGSGALPPIVVAAVIVRGSVVPQMSDLQPLVTAVTSFGSILILGMSISIGAPLDAFGKFVMQKAREA
jgi:hypothetical protein